MKKSVMKEKIKVIYRISPRQESITIDKLPMSDGAKSRAKRAGLTTIGDVLNNWNNLNASALVSDGNNNKKLGDITIKAIHAATFAWLAQNGCVSNLQYRRPCYE